MSVTPKAQIQNSLAQLVEDFVHRSPFFLFWKPENISQDISKRFLLSFDSLVKSFPSLIAQGASRLEDAESRTVLAVNLFQECGEGDVTRTHHAIYRKFLATAGISLSTITENLFATEWRKRLSEYLQTAPTGAVLGALAAGEFLAQPALGRIYPILKDHYPRADQEYFTKHLDLETEHVEEITVIIARQDGFEEVLEGFKFGLSVWETYFNKLAENLKSNTVFATDEWDTQDKKKIKF